MVDLASLTAADFTPLIGDRFDLAGASPSVRLELRSVEEGHHYGGRRRSFSLLFVGPEAPALTQGVWQLEHETFDDELEIFLVPIGPGPTGPRYEAVFT
jgi:hypothetical protein